jgi:nucleotide-binding universal stress UspA family protein
LNVVGLPRHDLEGRAKLETWLFGTGRPCLLYPDDREQLYSHASVVIAWDLSKSAARAVGDALPILKRASAVHAVTVPGEKEIPTGDPAAPLIEYLAVHEVRVVARQIEIQDRHVGTAVLEAAANLKADLLVMGAFGHSRVKEFVLGGATKEVLDAAALPVLMAH